MQKITGWVLFLFGALIAFACFGGALFLFFASSCESGEAQAGGQAFSFFGWLIGIPFFFLARYGWRLNYPRSPVNKTAGGFAGQIKPADDPLEKVYLIIHIVGDRALFFTTTRVIVANFQQDASIWMIPLSFIQPGAALSSSKEKKVKKLAPEEILMEDPLNYAIAYPGIQSIKIFPKWLSYKIKIVAENSAISFHPGNLRKAGPLGSQSFEFWLSRPWNWKKYVSTLRLVVQSKLEVPS